MKRKSVAEAKNTLHASAKQYKKNLIGNKILFVALKGKFTELYEVGFYKRNFKHLTGIESNVNANHFFDLALKNRLTDSMIVLNKDGTTDKKLDVILRLMNLPYNAKMLGTYNNLHERIVADKISGNVRSVMGFIYDNKLEENVPCTALKDDIREVANSPVLPIVAIFKKRHSDRLYREATLFSSIITKESLRKIDKLDTKVDFENMVVIAQELS